MRQDAARKKIEHYSYGLTDELGRGYSSVVYRARDDRNSNASPISDDTVAIKVVDMRMLKDELHRELLRSEINCLTELKGSRHVLRLIEVFTTANNTYIVTELCEGKDLSHQIQAHKGLKYTLCQVSEEQTISILRQLVVGYLDICQKGIVHRDLKPANIFFKDGVLKIADFGFAVKIDKCTRPMSYNIGSPSYMAPEALRDNRYSFRSDVWSLGVIAFETLHARVPWKSEDDRTLLKLLMNDPIQKHISREHCGNPYLMNFMKKCCNPYPGLRIEPNQLHEFISPMSMPTFVPQQHQTVQQLPPPPPQPPVQPHSVIVPSQQVHTSKPFTNVDVPLMQVSTTNKSIILPAASSTHNQTIIHAGSALGGGGGAGTAGLFNLLKSNPTKPGNSVFNPDPKPKFVDQTHGTKKPSSSLNLSLASVNTTFIGQAAGRGPQQAHDSIVAQLQYCRFMHCILDKLKELPAGTVQKEATSYFRSELVQKLSLLQRIVTTQENLFELDGFSELTHQPRFAQLRDLVFHYNEKFNEIYKGEPPKFNSNEALLVASIKSVDPDEHTHLLQLLLSYYQIKLLEKRIEYNDFAERTKIHLLMSDSGGSRMNTGKLKERMRLLGLL